MLGSSCMIPADTPYTTCITQTPLSLQSVQGTVYATTHVKCHIPPCIGWCGSQWPKMSAKRQRTARGSSSNRTKTRPTPAGSLAGPFLEGCGMTIAASFPYLASSSSSTSFRMSSYSSSSSSSSLVTCSVRRIRLNPLGRSGIGSAWPPPPSRQPLSQQHDDFRWCAVNPVFEWVPLGVPKAAEHMELVSSTSALLGRQECHAEGELGMHPLDNHLEQDGRNAMLRARAARVEPPLLC